MMGEVSNAAVGRTDHRNKQPLSSDKTTRSTENDISVVQEGLQERTARNMRRGTQHEVLHIVPLLTRERLAVLCI